MLMHCRQNGFIMTMRSVTKILKGQEITHAYTEPLDPLLTRKSILKLGKFFQVIYVSIYTNLVINN